VKMSPEEQELAVGEFVAKHASSYDPSTDDYERPPFAADIKEGKNDPIYNAHSYHTKVPPRSIIPYILHYTQPGDLILDPFCGSGMTGVAAQMCASPPADLLEQFSKLRDSVGPRACILNDLSPAACHIAYNYTTPVDIQSLKQEFERIRAAVKGEFDWLYSTEHYEPAVGLHDSANAKVAARLKNAPSGSPHTLIPVGDRTWELLDREEVETRLGYPVTKLPRQADWGDIDVAEVKQWVCIPALIQYTIWSDVYRCEGFVPVEEPTGKLSLRGKNVGKPLMKRRSVQRGCRNEFRLWDVGVDFQTREVRERFSCPSCGQQWTVDNATLLRTEPTSVIYEYTCFNKKHEVAERRVHRKLSRHDENKLTEIDASELKYWYPTAQIVPGEQGNPFLNRGIRTVDRFWTPRNLRALARLWREFDLVSDKRLQEPLRFLFTSVAVGICSRMTRYNFGKRGNGAMAMRLYFPHFQAEANVLTVMVGKLDDIAGYYTANDCLSSQVQVTTCPAQQMLLIPDSSIDFIFADPPFGRNIAYAELNILWEAWLGSTTDVSKEAITSNGRKWDVESYAEKMREAFKEMFRVLKPGRYALVEFNNSDPKLRLFEQIKLAAISAGFEICGMAILDKQHKSYNQTVGAIRGEDTVDKDVVFNLRRPSAIPLVRTTQNQDLERQVVDTVRQHLSSLPERIKSDPSKYSNEHRTTATIHSVLMNALIPRGVSVELLNLPLIERACERYFRKVGPHWYLRGEAVGNGTGTDSLFEDEAIIRDEVTAIAWLRQQLKNCPMLIGELKPLWMRTTGVLPAEECQELVLEDILTENFWRDPDTNRWREPTGEERERMNDDHSIRVLHDAERFVKGHLKKPTTDRDQCEWIDVLFQACRTCEDNDSQSLPALRGFEAGEGYRLIGRLFQTILREKVSDVEYARAEKQARIASQRLSARIEADALEMETKRAKRKGPTLFDGLDDA
jgi:hypothetical protein